MARIGMVCLSLLGERQNGSGSQAYLSDWLAFTRDEKIDNMVRFGDVWCKLVTHMRKKTKRFSVSLAEGDYKKLQRIANGHRPPFSLQFIVNWAIQGVLDRADDPQLLLELGNPLRKAQ
jgi:hypothetical protein